MKKIAFMLVCSTFLLSCYYDKADVINPNAAFVSCDTTTISYAKDIAPIMLQSCNSCHAGSASNGGGIVLDSYSTLKIYGQNKQLYSAVVQDGVFPKMPQGAAKLIDCDINKIGAWINQNYRP